MVDQNGSPISSAFVLNPKDTTEKAISDVHGIFKPFSSQSIDDIYETKKGYYTRELWQVKMMKDIDENAFS